LNYLGRRRRGEGRALFLIDVVFFRPAWLFKSDPSRSREQLMTNKGDDHVMDDACAFSEFYLREKMYRDRAAKQNVRGGIA